jgi:hypothetical protein
MSTNRCHRVRCSTRERAEAVIFIMAQKGIGPLYPEFCGICRSWHAVREKIGRQNGQGSGHKGTTEQLTNSIDVKTRACGADD